MSLVAVDPNRDYRTEIMDEIPRTYYPGRGFLSDQEAYPTDLYGNVRPPTLEYDPVRDGPPQIVPLPYFVSSRNQDNNPLKGGFNTGKALGAMAGYLGMGFGPAPRAAIFSPGPMLAGRYSDLMKERNERINSGRTPGIIPEINASPTPGIIPEINASPTPGIIPEINASPTPGIISEMPRFIRGNYRPGGVFGSPPPNLDSPFMDERIKRGFVPMTPPPSRGGGPQLPGFV